MKWKMIETRQAGPDDIPAICAFDHVAQIQEDRREFIRKAIGDGISQVALVDGAIAGHTVFGISCLMSSIHLSY